TVAASNKAGVGEINVPISCGGASIQPHDIIVGDADGVVVIPQTVEQDILNKSLKKMENDQKRADSVLQNKERIMQYLDN
ncbi:hypothetical protein JEQ20_25625, partial [Klebsiella pneumoniae]|nr:hypothetical protein [Klebsiella pneumoniae]